MQDAKNHRRYLHIVFVFKDVFVETLLEFVVVVAGIVEVGKDGDAATDAVLFGVAVDDEVFAAFPVDHHEGAVGFAEEGVHGAGDAVLRQRDDFLGIIERQTALQHLLLMKFQEHLELFEILVMRLAFQEILDLLVHLGAALGRFEHLAHNRLAALPRLRHISLNISLFVEVRKELFDEGGHRGVVGGAGGVAHVGVGVRRLVEDDFGTLGIRKRKPILPDLLSQLLQCLLNHLAM